MGCWAGMVGHETDVMGRTTAYTRRGKTYGNQYDLYGNITQWQAGSSTVNATYGKFGINGYTSSSLEEIAFDYDPNGYLAKKEHGGFVMQYAFDELGRVTHYGSPSGDIAQYQYNALHQVTSIAMDGKNYTYQYYDDGQVKSVTYPNGMVQSYTYDNLNRTKTIQATLDNTTLLDISYTYDGRGNIATETVDGVQAAYTYDGRNRLKTVTKGGVTTTYAYDANNNRLSDTTSDGSVTEYAYDNFGNLLTKTDRNGTKLSYTYAVDNQPLSITTAEAADGIQPASVSFAYNAVGLPISAEAGEQTTDYHYDSFGRLTHESTGSVQRVYGYDDNGNVTGLRISTLNETLYQMEYAYDACNQLVTAVAPDMTRTYTYNANGALGSETDAGGTTAYTYNQAGLLTGISGPGITESYAYALNGRKQSETAYDGTQKSYAYDGAGRLVSETFGANSITYSYDKRGNRTRLAEYINGEGREVSYAYDRANRLLQETADTSRTDYYYDAAGNLYAHMTVQYAPDTGEQPAFSVSEDAPGTASYRYNALGQQISAAVNGRTAAYTYDAAGLRTGKRVDGAATALVYVNGAVVAETGSATNLYYRANGKILYAETGGAITPYTYNGHGDVVRAGTQSYQYDAFGNQLTANETDTNPFRYAGEYYDGETGNIYYWSIIGLS